MSELLQHEYTNEHSDEYIVPELRRASTKILGKVIGYLTLSHERFPDRTGAMGRGFREPMELITVFEVIAESKVTVYVQVRRIVEKDERGKILMGIPCMDCGEIEWLPLDVPLLLGRSWIRCIPLKGVWTHQVIR